MSEVPAECTGNTGETHFAEYVPARRRSPDHQQFIDASCVGAIPVPSADRAKLRSSLRRPAKSDREGYHPDSCRTRRLAALLLADD